VPGGDQMPRLGVGIEVGAYSSGRDWKAVVLMYCGTTGSGERGEFIVYSVAVWHRALMDDESTLGSRERWRKD